MVRPDGLSWRSTRPKCNGRWRIARPKTAPTLGTRARTRGFPSAQRGRPCCNATRTRAPDPAQPCGALSWAPARPTARPSADDQCACACHVRVAKVRRTAMLVAHAGSRPFPAPWWLARRQPKLEGRPHGLADAGVTDIVSEGLGCTCRAHVILVHEFGRRGAHTRPAWEMRVQQQAEWVRGPARARARQ